MVARWRPDTTAGSVRTPATVLLVDVHEQAAVLLAACPGPGHLVDGGDGRLALARGHGHRGAQFRDDYPEKDETSGRVNIVVRRGPHGEMQVSREPLPALSPELAAIIEEMK